MKRKLIGIFLVTFMVILSLAGCNNGGTESSSQISSQDETESGNVESSADGDEVLRILHPVFDMDWSPMRGGGWSSWYLSFWWTAPIIADQEGVLHPGVFNEWSNSDNLITWTFKIDTNAKFSDGTPITADDVIGTWNRNCMPETVHQRIDLFLSGVVGFEEIKLGNVKELSGLKKIDGSTIEVTLSAPDPLFASKIATNMLAPVKISQVVDESGAEIVEWWTPEKGVTVTGPFMPVEMDLDKGYIVFERNPNWWGETAKLKGIEITSVEDPQTAILKIKNGEADMGPGIQITEVNIQALGVDYFSAGADEIWTPSGNYFWFNIAIEPFDDINVRKALIMSVDHKEMYGVANPNLIGGFSPNALLDSFPGIPTPEPLPYDPEAAKAALAASKYGNAENLPKIIITGVVGDALGLAGQYMVEQWRQVLGITRVELKGGFDTVPEADKGRVAIMRDDIGSRMWDAVNLLKGSIHSNSGVAVNKMGGYLNEEIDRLLDEASILSLEDPRRNELAIEAEKLFIQDAMCISFDRQASAVVSMPYVINKQRNLDGQWFAPWLIDIKK